MALIAFFQLYVAFRKYTLLVVKLFEKKNTTLSKPLRKYYIALREYKSFLCIECQILEKLNVIISDN